jgi:hypothetical protein
MRREEYKIYYVARRRGSVVAALRAPSNQTGCGGSAVLMAQPAADPEAAALSGEDGMDQLTDSAKELIEKQCTVVLERYKDALREVEVYKWAARVFFTLVLGGSIVGFFQLQTYLDDRIAKGTSTLERLFYAKQLSDANQPMDALPELLEYARSVSSSRVPENTTPEGSQNMFGDFGKAGPSVRSYFFFSLLDVLTSIPSLEPEAASFGRIEWDNLFKNTRFHQDIIINPVWQNNGRALNRLGLGTAKFARDRQEVLGSKRYFEQQLQYDKGADGKAASSFVLGIFALADNDVQAAAQHFVNANGLKPKWVLSEDEYFATPDQLYWIKLFPSLAEFRSRYVAAYKLVYPPAN